MGFLGDFGEKKRDSGGKVGIFRGFLEILGGFGVGLGMFKGSQVCFRCPSCISGALRCISGDPGVFWVPQVYFWVVPGVSQVCFRCPGCLQVYFRYPRCVSGAPGVSQVCFRCVSGAPCAPRCISGSPRCISGALRCPRCIFRCSQVYFGSPRCVPGAHLRSTR